MASKAQPRATAVSEEDRPVAAVERAMRIFDAFRMGDFALTLTELAERTGLYKSTVMRLASTLEKSGYLERTASGDYCLGAMTLQLALVYRASVRPPEVILPLMRKLVADTGESATYSVRRGDLRICVYRVDSPSRIRDHFNVGDVFPIGMGASGRVFTMFEKAMLRRGPIERSKLVLSSTDELVDGMAGIAAPTFDENGDLSGALALSGPKTRLTRDALRRMTPKLIDTVHHITLKLGGDVSAYGKARAV